MNNIPSFILDKSNQPLILYHGTAAFFTHFDPSTIGTGEGTRGLGHGFYFTKYKHEATEYAGENGRVIEVTLKAANILDINNPTISAIQITDLIKKYANEIQLKKWGNNDHVDMYIDRLSNKAIRKDEIIGYGVIEIVKNLSDELNQPTSTFIEELGFDTIKDGPHYIVFDTSQIQILPLNKTNINEKQLFLTQDDKSEQRIRLSPQWEEIEHNGMKWQIITNEQEIRKAINVAIEANNLTKLPDVPADFYFGKENLEFKTSPFPGISFRGMNEDGYKAYLDSGRTGYFWTGHPGIAFGGKGYYMFAGKEYEPYDQLRHIEDNGNRKPEDVYAIWHNPAYREDQQVSGKVASQWILIYQNPNFDMTRLGIESNKYKQIEQVPSSIPEEATCRLETIKEMKPKSHRNRNEPSSVTEYRHLAKAFLTENPSQSFDANVDLQIATKLVILGYKKNNVQRGIQEAWLNENTTEVTFKQMPPECQEKLSYYFESELETKIKDLYKEGKTTPEVVKTVVTSEHYTTKETTALIIKHATDVPKLSNEARKVIEPIIKAAEKELKKPQSDLTKPKSKSR